MSTVAEVIGTIVARLGVGHAFGVVGSGNFHVTNALRAGGVPFVAARHETGRGDDGRRLRAHVRRRRVPAGAVRAR